MLQASSQAQTADAAERGGQPADENNDAQTVMRSARGTGTVEFKQVWCGEVCGVCPSSGRAGRRCETTGGWWRPFEATSARPARAIPCTRPWLGASGGMRHASASESTSPKPPGPCAVDRHANPQVATDCAVRARHFYPSPPHPPVKVAQGNCTLHTAPELPSCLLSSLVHRSARRNHRRPQHLPKAPAAASVPRPLLHQAPKRCPLRPSSTRSVADLPCDTPTIWLPAPPTPQP